MNNKRKVMINAVVSDLFFNHTHDQYEALFGDREVSHEDMATAILEDAKEFVDAYGAISEIGQYTAQEFADDFMARL